MSLRFSPSRAPGAPAGRRRGLRSIAVGGALVATLLPLGGCVLSTHTPPGTPPDVPVPPSPAEPAASPAEETGPTTISARHVLVSFAGGSRAASYVTRTREEAFQRASEVRERALAGEDFAELAREYSDDRGSAQAGGDLGEFTRSQMVKPFADAAFALEPGGVSPVIESEFGFHVIQRTE